MANKSDDETPLDAENDANEFEKLGDEQEMSILRECWAFIAENKKWWLLPMMIVLGLVSVLILLTSTGAGPFVYALF